MNFPGKTPGTWGWWWWWWKIEDTNNIIKAIIVLQKQLKISTNLGAGRALMFTAKRRNEVVQAVQHTRQISKFTKALTNEKTVNVFNLKQQEHN